jgi:leucyl-tRNA synthetase
MVLAPEHPLVPMLTSQSQQADVDAYILASKARTELDRIAETKIISGVFTGSFCTNPFNNEPVPIYLADYVLAGYGTGAVMGVPSGDQRDWNFAKHFNLPIIPVLDAQKEIDIKADNTKEGKYVNSGIINGLGYKEATSILISKIEELKIGKGKIQYRLRNAVFSRQRYWGEPVPVYFKTNNEGQSIPYLIEPSQLPLKLPEVDRYLPTPTGEPPLGNAVNWKYTPSNLTNDAELEQYDYELSTMPGWAGSSWYWFRYMDNQNQEAIASKEAIEYWQDVDLYIGGSEHATGHLLYSRFWNKFLKDIGIAPKEEFAQKLINQGMIQGRSSFVYRLKSSEGIGQSPVFVSAGLKADHETTALHIDVNMVENDILDIERFKKWRPDFENAEFILENEKYICGFGVEKMSKRLYNVVNPDDIIDKYGADTLRLYEMFLGPLEQSKPWNTNGISGTYNFLRKLWRLFVEDQSGVLKISDAAPTQAELKVLHKTIKKVQEDIERYSFNTVVSTFMICVNELGELKCSKKLILRDLLVLMSPFAPHITEELWQLSKLGSGDISSHSFPVFDPSYLVESSFEYPISINGKVRKTISYPVDMPINEIEKGVLLDETIQKWLEGKTPKKIIVVPKRIINVVV